jgi:hypothetical protein
MVRLFFKLPPPSNRGVKVTVRGVRFMVPNYDCIIKSAGIDWLTLTSSSPATKLKMMEYFSSVAEEDRKLGHSVVPGGNYGFYGKRARHALFAEKEDRAMLQVSGRRAQRSILLCREGDNATRIDVQITLFVGEENVSKVLEEWAEQAEHPGKINCHPREVTRVLKSGKTQTVYIGSRKSDFYVRLYDKYAESKESDWKGCVRLEVEIKGKASKALWSHLAEEGLGNMYLLQVLLWHLERCGLNLSMIDLCRQDILLPKREPLKEERSLIWLAGQVAPTVQRLCMSRGWIAAFSVLFAGALEDVDRSAIMRSLSRQWGN